MLSEFNISREQIIAQYWGFTRLEPERTNGNIAGQVRALDSLRDMLGFEGPQPGEKPDGEGEGDSKPQIYRPKWMRKPGDPDYEDDEALDAVLGVVNPAVASSEPLPKPAVVPQTPAVRPSGDTTNRAVEPAEPQSWARGANFGRFQGL